VREGSCGISNEIFQVGTFQIGRHNLPFCVRPKRNGIANFTTKFNKRDRGLHIVGVRQKIIFDSDQVDWVLSDRYAPGSLAARRLPAAPRNLEEG
jgi:hypothetical protein